MKITKINTVLLATTVVSFYIFLDSIGSDFWRMLFAGIGLIGFVVLTIFSVY